MKIANLSNLSLILVIISVFVYDSKNWSLYIFWAINLTLISLTIVRVYYRPTIIKNSIRVFLTINGWILWSIIPFFTYYDKKIAITYVLLTAFYTVTSICIVNSFNLGNRNFKILTRGIVLTSVFWILFSIPKIIIQLLNPEVEVSGLYSNRNTFALMCSYLFLANLYLLERKQLRNTSNKIILCMICLCLVSFIVLTGSIKGMFSVFIIAIAFNISKLTIKKIFSFVLVLSLIILVIFTDNIISERLWFILDSYSGSEGLRVSQSAYIRQFYVIEGLNLIKDNPFFGLGIYQSKYHLIPEYFYILFDRGDIDELVGQYSHNNYIEMGLNGGIVGFAIYYIPFVFISCKLIANKFKKINIEDYNIKLIYSIVGIKLFNDYGMVSYYEFHSLLQLVVLYSVYFNVSRRKS